MFGDQYSVEWLIADIWYYLAAFMAVVAVAALALIDLGATRKENLLHSAVQKMGAIIAGGFGMMWIGYPIWQWQFNQAFGVPEPLGQALSDWWFGGALINQFAVNLDPAVVAEADVLQIFFVFFIAFGMLTGALLHGALAERVKTVPLMIASFVLGGLLQPVLGYLFWGSMSPFTNNGFHDFAAIAPVYIGTGAFAVAMNLVIRPRLGRFTPHPSGAAPKNSAPTLSLVGVLLLMGVLPFIMVGNGYFIPGSGFYGIAFNTSGIGSMAANLIVAFVGGGLSGLVIAFLRREYSWAMYGPLVGYVITGSLIDVARPWQSFLVSLFGPPLMLVGHLILERLRIDDSKASLAILPGAVGMIVTGFVAWGTKQGGYPGLTGEYEFQGAEITPWMQTLGVVVALVVSFGLGLVVAYILKFTTGLRIPEHVESASQDDYYWNWKGGLDVDDVAVASGSNADPTASADPAR